MFGYPRRGSRTTGDRSIAYLAYPFVTGTLLYALVRHGIGILYPGHSASTHCWCAFAGVAGVVSPTLTWGTVPFQSLFAMTLGPNFLGGIVLTGLAVVLLTHSALVQRRWSFPNLMTVWVITYASTLSDKLMIPHGTVPAFLLTGWIVVRQPAQRTRSMLWAGVLGSSTIVALASERYFVDFGVGIGRAGRPEFRLSGLVDVLGYLPRLVIAYPAWGASLLILVGALIHAATRKQLSLTPASGSDAALLLWALAAMAFLSALTCALFAFADVNEFRRMLPAFTIPIALAPAVLINMFANHSSSVIGDQTQTQRHLICALAVALAITLASSASVLATPAGAFDLSLEQPVLATCIDRLRAQGVLDAGLTDFWNARLINLTGKKVITNVALWSDGEPMRTSLNLRSSLGRDSANHPGRLLNVNYIVPQGLDRPAVLQRYGQPERTLRCADQDIWVYPDGALRPQVEEMRQQAAYRLTRG